LLNPDCFIFPHTIRKLRKALQAHEDAAVVGALVFNEDGSEQRGCRRNEPTLKRSAITALGLGRRFQGVDLTGNRLPSSITEVDAVSGAAMMIRAEHYRDAGGLDEDYFLHCEDLDICRNMRDLGYQVLFDPEVSVFHRQGTSGKTPSLVVERHKHQGMIIYSKKHKSRKHGSIETALTIVLVWMHFAAGAIGSRLKTLFNRSKAGENDDSSHADHSLIAGNTRKTVVVTGAKSDIGDYLLDHLEREDIRTIAITRSPAGARTAGTNIRWLALEFFKKTPLEDFGEIDVWINLAPVWTGRTLNRVIRRFKPRRIIALSSTSVIAKAESEDKTELELVKKLKDGERWVEKQNRSSGVSTVIIRPTLIYGGPRNQNVNFIENVIRYFRCFPLIDDGRGLRQPVHAEDLATACLRLLKVSDTQHRVYVLAGAEELSYRVMVSRIFTKLGIKPRMPTFSLTWVKRALGLIRLLPGLGFLSPQMAERMRQDLVYSIEEAVDDFGFNPKKFEP